MTRRNRSNGSIALRLLGWLCIGIGVLATAAFVFALIVGIVGFLASVLWSLLSAAVGLVPFLVVGGIVWWLLVDDDGEESARIGGQHGPGRSSADADRSAPIPNKEPEEALREQYVEGNISEAEFERRLDGLLDADRRREQASAAEREREADGSLR